MRWSYAASALFGVAVALVACVADEPRGSGDTSTADGVADASIPDATSDTAGETSSCVDGLKQPCGTVKGECSRGTRTCEDGTWSACRGHTPPSRETCDGKDNDCDGAFDETCSCTDGETQSCGSQQGACKSGTQTCRDGTWGPCEGRTGASKETCDGKDNDCDGSTDEDFPNKGKACDGSDADKCMDDVYACAASGSKTTCTDRGSKRVERCDGKDNDCDGSTDENFCAIWVLKSGLKRWQGESLNAANDPNAPKKPIRGVFDIERRDTIIVMTDKTYRSYDPTTRKWGTPRNISNLSASFASAEIAGALSFPAGDAGNPPGHDDLMIMVVRNGEPKLWEGTFQPGSMTVNWETRGQDLPSGFLQNKAGWHDDRNARGWVVGNPQKICGDSTTSYPTSVGPYNAYIHTTGEVSLAEAEYCYRELSRRPYQRSVLAGYTNAPPTTTRIGAATWHQGDLYLWRGR